MTPAASHPPPRAFHRLYTAGLVCFLGALLTGLASGLVAAFPLQTARWPGIAAIRPLHTLFALAWLFFGLGACTGFFCADGRRRFTWLAEFEFWSLTLFLAVALGATALGWFSGFEYLSWPWPATVILFAALGANLVVAWSGQRRMAGRSPEAAWLVVLGALLLPAALGEHALLHSARLAANLGASLTVEWHALDTLITGWSVVLYGTGVLAVDGHAKPLRAGWLFAIALIGILLDFGHHNYPSPQAHLIKLVSFAATMLAVVSLIRHLRSRAKDSDRLNPTLLLLRHAEAWIIFAVATGILMAVPWINFYVHGTYAVVGHSMGAIIGVNSFLLLAVGYRGEATLSPRLRTWFLVASWALGALVASFIGLGVAAGIRRVHADYPVWTAWLRPAYVVLPAAGAVVLIAFGLIAVDLIKRSLRRSSERHSWRPPLQPVARPLVPIRTVRSTAAGTLNAPPGRGNADQANAGQAAETDAARSNAEIGAK